MSLPRWRRGEVGLLPNGDSHSCNGRAKLRPGTCVGAAHVSGARGVLSLCVLVVLLSFSATSALCLSLCVWLPLRCPCSRLPHLTAVWCLDKLAVYT